MRIVREVSLLQKKKIMVSRCFYLLNRISQVTCYQFLFLYVYVSVCQTVLPWYIEGKFGPRGRVFPPPLTPQERALTVRIAINNTVQGTSDEKDSPAA